ncbi:uncharacterized protein LOC135610028 isoform X1 [Musa acuminata AAA Group]|uniref:uncharacterized protein LOC135610028 isoform X1 n=1 Tax=Musa acuminata AAA Group TaxID=214697 RepID=UPI0031CEEEC6
MASGESSGRAAASDSNSFDFGSDDVLCPYGDYAAQDPSIGKRSNLPGTQDIQECRMGRSLVSAYEKEDCSKYSVTSSVEKCMKKYADTLLQSLEAISGRLSQMEIHFHKLEQSLCELRGDFIQDQSDKDLNFKSLEKHLQEVHRSVQIMRDKQELAETHKELAKLQMVQKESVEKKEEVVARSVSEPKKLDDKPDVANQQLALALPRPATSPPILPDGTSQSIQPYKELPMQHQPPISYNIQLDQIIMSQAARYYHHHQTLPHSQPVQARPQLQDGPVQAPPRQPLIANQNRPPSFSQYQQQLPSQPAQHLAQQVAQPQQPASQTQPSYPPYPPQPVPATFPDSSVPTQVPQPNVTAIRPEVLPFGDGRTGSLGSQPHLHNMQQPMLSPVSQSSFGSQLSKGSYMGGSTTHPPPPYNLQGYNAASSYPPNNNLPVARNQQIPPSNSAALPYDSRLTRNHSYGEMIEKAVGMGYDRNQIIGAVQRMVESGQPMDFHSLLDRLNGQAAAAPARAW